MSATWGICDDPQHVEPHNDTRPAEVRAGRLEPLDPAQLRRVLDPASLGFKTTEEVDPLTETVGQPRALDALDLGLAVRAPGYNIYVAGPAGSGRTTTTRDYVEARAESMDAPRDWVYVHNFSDPDHPQAISLTSGSGERFARAMDEFIASLGEAIPRAFESEEHSANRNRVLEEIGGERDAATSNLEERAGELGFAVQMTPAGFVSVPLRLGRPLATAEFERLSSEERAEIEQRGGEVQAHIAETVRALRRLEKQAQERIADLDRELVAFAAGPMLHDLREQYGAEPRVLEFLRDVEGDLPEHIDAFRDRPGSELPPPLRFLQPEQASHTARYRVNVLVAYERASGAPVVVERNPTYYNLGGRIDYRATLGALTTDFHQVKPGALQRANGGFLVLQAIDVLRNPFAWDALKRSLGAREARIENLAEQVSAIPTATLRPEPIPLDLKVILIGSPSLYHVLCGVDEEFRELFKVKVDFAPDMEWSDRNVGYYASFVSRRVRENELLHFDAAAVARVVEHGARLRDDQRKLSTRLLDIADLVTEASFVASRAGVELVGVDHVDEAIAKRRYRSNLYEERLQELIADGTIAIATQGERIGQLNGLSVLQLGDFRFGKPARVTATVSLGEGHLTSIEREIELSGPIHSKGFLTLSGLLARLYAQDQPLALSAKIAFEQEYDEIEGDSASSAEFYAMVSAISGLPLRQDVAATGSINQHGEIQAVGAVTTKIEGFFDVCAERGLTGEQGVLIPSTNVENLMLRRDVVDAAERGKFHIWAIRDVDEGLRLLMGCEPGERDADGEYAEGTIHRAALDRLQHYAATLQSFGRNGGAGHDADGRRLGL